jgi:tetraacyldisaccharide 4'-kinase
MEARFLREWQRTSLWQVLLRPVSWLFGLLVTVRRALYRLHWVDSERLDVPVIVVGNITVGGTGKTPLVLALTGILRDAGFRPGIVTRGYSRNLKRGADGFIIHVVPAQGGQPASDEATLLANRSGVPVYSGVDRVAAAHALRKAHSAVNVIVSDDGLQHYALKRDIELCVIDGGRGLGNGALLPAGPLRESPSRLTEVDAMVVNGGLKMVNAIPDIPLFSMALANESFVGVRDGQSLTPDAWRLRFNGRKIAAIAGTGNPARFFTHINDIGIQVGSTHAFADHHPFVASDLNAIDAEIVLMTEKDAVKCQAFADDRMWFMRVDAVLPDAFTDFVLARLSQLKA